MKEEGKEGIPSIRRLGPRISHPPGTRGRQSRKMMEVEHSASSKCLGAFERRRETSTTGGVEEEEGATIEDPTLARLSPDARPMAGWSSSPAGSKLALLGYFVRDGGPIPITERPGPQGKIKSRKRRISHGFDAVGAMNYAIHR